MVTCIKLKGKHNIGVNEHGQISAFDTKISLKDIPFVRYDFEQYGAEELAYIKSSMERFSISAHLIQYNMNEHLLDSIDNTIELADKVAKFLYIPLEQSEFEQKAFDSVKLQTVQQALGKVRFDRIMFLDKTYNLDMATAKSMINDFVKLSGIGNNWVKNIGICSSPLCMSGEYACLNAVKARELLALYNNSPDVALPTANHQCMNNCGCIRYFEVTSDIPAPAVAVSTKSSGKKSSGSSEPKEKKPKTVSIDKLPASAFANLF